MGERELQLVLEGRSPDSGDLLTRRPLRVPGFDVTFSAPKSVSVLFGIADEAVKGQVLRAHDIAARDAFAYLEREAAMTRRGRDGRELVGNQGLVAAAFLRRTSRAGDPQLHTHVLVANLTRSVDGVWRALDGRRLYAHARLRRQAIKRMTAAEIEALGQHLASPAGLTETRSVVTRRAAIQAWCERMPLGRHVTVEEIEADVDRLLSSRAFVRLLVPPASAGGAIRRADGRVVASMPDERHYTTPDLLAAEERIIEFAAQPA